MCSVYLERLLFVNFLFGCVCTWHSLLEVLAVRFSDSLSRTKTHTHTYTLKPHTRLPNRRPFCGFYPLSRAPIKSHILTQRNLSNFLAYQNTDGRSITRKLEPVALKRIRCTAEGGRRASGFYPILWRKFFLLVSADRSLDAHRFRSFRSFFFLFSR